MCGLLSYCRSRLKEHQPKSSQWCDPKRYDGESVGTVKLASSELKVFSDFVLSWCYVHFLQISIPSNNAMFLRLLLLQDLNCNPMRPCGIVLIFHSGSSLVFAGPLHTISAVLCDILYIELSSFTGFQKKSTLSTL